MEEPHPLSRRAVLEVAAALREMPANASSAEVVAQRMVRHLYDHLRDANNGERICALARLFMTIRFGSLPPSLQTFGQSITGEPSIPISTRCLTLLASAGDEPAWDSRHTSVGHQAIPLTSREMVSQSPMISQLLTQFGVDVDAVVTPDARLMLPAETPTYNIFHVPEAKQSPHVPAQDAFVIPYRITSVVGFGGPLTDGNLFTIILFSKTRLTVDTVSLFHGIALSAKLALLAVADKPVFVKP
jgi:two-component system NtrC family sensor kinase